MFTPAENPVLTAKYLVLIGLLGAFLMWAYFGNEGTVWWFGLVPIVPVLMWYAVDRQEFKCPECGEYWALKADEWRFGQDVTYVCRHCMHRFDPYRDAPPVDGQGDHPPARGGEKLICRFLVGMGALLLVLNLFTGISSWVEVFAPVFMIGVGIARLRGWVRRWGEGSH